MLHCVTLYTKENYQAIGYTAVPSGSMATLVRRFNSVLSMPGSLQLYYLFCDVQYRKLMCDNKVFPIRKVSHPDTEPVYPTVSMCIQVGGCLFPDWGAKCIAIVSFFFS